MKKIIGHTIKWFLILGAFVGVIALSIHQIGSLPTIFCFGGGAIITLLIFLASHLLDDEKTKPEVRKGYNYYPTPKGKYQLELNFTDHRIFLNFWDHMHGQDVVCEIKDGKLWHTPYSVDHIKGETREMSVEEFVKSIAESINDWRQ